MTDGNAVVVTIVATTAAAVFVVAVVGAVGLTIAFVFSKGSNRASYGSISAPC